MVLGSALCVSTSRPASVLEACNDHSTNIFVSVGKSEAWLATTTRGLAIFSVIGERRAEVTHKCFVLRAVGHEELRHSRIEARGILDTLNTLLQDLRDNNRTY